MAEMEVVRQFNSELSTLYATKPPISRAKVTSITRLALKAVKYYKHVVQSLEKFVQKCRPEYKIPALYVIDSIIRQSRHQFGAEKDVFGPRFGRNIANSFQNFFKCLPEEQSKLIKVLNLWQKNKVYPPEVIQPLLNMALTKSSQEQQGSAKFGQDVKAVPADTTQPVVGHTTQHHSTRPSDTVVEAPQEQSYITLLQQQQEQQMKQIEELEARLKQQQKMNIELQQYNHLAPVTQPSEAHLSGEAKFQLPNEVFAQIQALTNLVNQPSASHHASNFGNDKYNQYASQSDHQQMYQPGFEETQHENTYMAPQQHPTFVDDFDYGDDEDDAQRIEEKKRLLQEEEIRLKEASSFNENDAMNVRQNAEEQFRHHQQPQQHLVSGNPPPIAPANVLVAENMSAPVEPDVVAPPVYHESSERLSKPRSRSRSPRDRRHREGDRDRERGPDRDRQQEGWERDKDRHRSRNREDRDRDRWRGDRDEREKSRGERSERERSRVEREEREKGRVDRDGREKSREDRDRNRGDRDERGKVRVDREERERTREKERARETQRETESQQRRKEDKEDEIKEEKVEKWIPRVKEGHVSVCSRTVWVGRVSRNTMKEDLQELFQPIGEVQLIDMVPPRGCAYVQMAEREAAYRSLSSKQILKMNFKLAWAPAKGAKEYKDCFDKELGVTYIPVSKLEESKEALDKLEEGGWLDPRTVPESLRQKAEADTSATTSTANVPGVPMGVPVLGVPMGPMPFPVPGMARFPPPGMPPGMPLPGIIPPGMNIPGMPPVQFPPGMGNLPFPRPPQMDNQLPFVPGVNPFMMPGMMPGMQPPGMAANVPGSPFFPGNAPPPTTENSGPTEGNSNPESQGSKRDSGDLKEGNLCLPDQQQVQPSQDIATVNVGEPAFQASIGDQMGHRSHSGPEGQNSGPFGGAPDQIGPQFQGQGGDPALSGGNHGMGPGVPPFPGGPPIRGPGGQPFPVPGSEPSFGGRPGEPQFRGPPPFQGHGGENDPWRSGGGGDGSLGQEAEQWDTEGGQWGSESEQWGPEGGHSEAWGNQGGHSEEWEHNEGNNGQWGWENEQPFFDRRDGRRWNNRDERWGPEPPYDRRRHGRFDEERHDRRRGPPFDHRGRPPFDRDRRPFDDFPGPRHEQQRRGPPFPMGDGPPFGRDGPPFGRDGPPFGRDGPPFGRDGPPPFGRDGAPPFAREGPPFRGPSDGPPFRGPPDGPPFRGPPDGPPFRGPPDGPRRDGPPFRGRPPWMHEGPDVRPDEQWVGESRGQLPGNFEGNLAEPIYGHEMESKILNEGENMGWQGHHGDGEVNSNIPSLIPEGKPALGNVAQFETSDVHQSVVTASDEAKGWAEIKELKARLEMNKKKGNDSSSADDKDAKASRFEPRHDVKPSRFEPPEERQPSKIEQSEEAGALSIEPREAAEPYKTEPGEAAELAETPSSVNIPGEESFPSTALSHEKTPPSTYDSREVLVPSTSELREESVPSAAQSREAVMSTMNESGEETESDIFHSQQPAISSETEIKLEKPEQFEPNDEVPMAADVATDQSLPVHSEKMATDVGLLISSEPSADTEAKLEARDPVASVEGSDLGNAGVSKDVMGSGQLTADSTPVNAGDRVYLSSALVGEDLANRRMEADVGNKVDTLGASMCPVGPMGRSEAINVEGDGDSGSAVQSGVIVSEKQDESENVQAAENKNKDTPSATVVVMHENLGCEGVSEDVEQHAEAEKMQKVIIASVDTETPQDAVETPQDAMETNDDVSEVVDGDPVVEEQAKDDRGTGVGVAAVEKSFESNLVSEHQEVPDQVEAMDFEESEASVGTEQNFVSPQISVDSATEQPVDENLAETDASVVGGDA